MFLPIIISVFFIVFFAGRFVYFQIDLDSLTPAVAEVTP